MAYVEHQVHVVLSNCCLLAPRLFNCIGCQNAYTHVKNIGVHPFTHIQYVFKLLNGYADGIWCWAFHLFMPSWFIIYLQKMELDYDYNFIIYILFIIQYKTILRSTSRIHHLQSFIASCIFPQIMHQGTLNQWHQS
jgi:hypothetical protein